MLFDLSKNVILTTRQKRYYTFGRMSVLLVALCAVLFFISELLLPTLKFHFNAAVDSLANTITRPVQYTEKIFFSVVTAQDVDRARITLTLSDTSPHPENMTLSLQKSYGAFLYPLQPMEERTYTETVPPFPEGSLIASRDGVYVTSGNNKHAFDTEESLLASGYSFENIISATSDERAFYKKGKIFSLTSYHPAGTLFYTQDTDITFRVNTNNTITPLATHDMRNAIVVDEASRDSKITCVATKRLFPKNTYTCDLDLTEIAHFPGKRYQFSTSAIAPEDIAKITISLSTKKSYHNILSRLTQVKSLLRDQYSK